MKVVLVALAFSVLSGCSGGNAETERHEEYLGNAVFYSPCVKEGICAKLEGKWFKYSFRADCPGKQPATAELYNVTVTYKSGDTIFYEKRGEPVAIGDCVLTFSDDLISK